MEEYGVTSPPADFGLEGPPAVEDGSWFENEVVRLLGLVGGAPLVVRPLVPAGRGSGIITDSSLLLPKRADSPDLESLTVIGLERCQLKLVTACANEKKSVPRLLRIKQ
jgi:hypothetical protein